MIRIICDENSYEVSPKLLFQDQKTFFLILSTDQIPTEEIFGFGFEDGLIGIALSSGVKGEETCYRGRKYSREELVELME